MDGMFDKLENLLNTWTYPERSELYMRAVTVLDQHGTHRAWSEISQFLEYTNDSAAECLDSIDSILSIDVDRVLTEHSIVTETTLAVKVAILEGILTIQVLEDSETILRLLDSSDNEMDVFIELMAFATNRPWEYFSDGLISVSPALCTRLREVIENATATMEALTVPPSEQAVRLNKFIELFPNSMITNEVINEFALVGTPLNILQDRFKIALNMLSEGSPRAVAIELVGMVILSDTDPKDMDSCVKQQPDHFYSDIRYITDVAFELDNILREVLHGST